MHACPCPDTADSHSCHSSLCGGPPVKGRLSWPVACQEYCSVYNFFCFRYYLIVPRTFLYPRKVIVLQIRLLSSSPLFPAAFAHAQGYFLRHYDLLHDESRIQGMSIPLHVGRDGPHHCIHVRSCCRSALYTVVGSLQTSSHAPQLFCCRVVGTATRKHRLSLLPGDDYEGDSLFSGPLHTPYHAFQAGACSGRSGTQVSVLQSFHGEQPAFSSVSDNFYIPSVSFLTSLPIHTGGIVSAVLSSASSLFSSGNDGRR